MTIDVSLSALAGIAMVCGALCYTYTILAKRSAQSEAADIATWNCWRDVALQAIEKGAGVPPTPHEKAKH